MPSAATVAMLDSWELSLHQLRPRTVGHYLAELARFADWLTANDLPASAPGDLVAVSKRDVERWVAAQRQAQLSQATIRNRWVALRSFYRWAHDEGETATNPVATIIVAKANPPAPDVLDGDQLRALLKACDGTAFAERRDAALIRVAVATGMRASELVGLELADVDLRTRVLAVRDGKGGKARAVRIDPSTAAALDRYRRVRARHRLAHLPALWLGPRGPLTRKGLGPLLDRRASVAGIGHVHPHQLRHTFADRWLSAGGSESDLLRLGGWENSDIMRRYGEARAVDRALAAFDQVDPMRGI